jgi:hypothetical protein
MFAFLINHESSSGTGNILEDLQISLLSLSYSIPFSALHLSIDILLTVFLLSLLVLVAPSFREFLPGGCFLRHVDSRWLQDFEFGASKRRWLTRLYFALRC